MTNCADLGTEPEILDERLHKTFLRGRNWGSIILLEDAEDLVCPRNKHELKRSGLVSIFLRHLEYSEGVHFITTSNDCRIDPALYSRTTLCFGLPRLSFEDQQSIWLTFIDRIDKKYLGGSTKELVSYIRNDLKELNHGHHIAMNGRQIRNCVDGALALARAERVTFQPKHIQRMLVLGKEFQTYLEQDAEAASGGRR